MLTCREIYCVGYGWLRKSWDNTSTFAFAANNADASWYFYAFVTLMKGN